MCSGALFLYLSAENIDIIISSNLTHVKDKDDREHLKLLAPNYKYDIVRCSFDLKNLFNGNKQLGKESLTKLDTPWTTVFMGEAAFFC